MSVEVRHAPINLNDLLRNILPWSVAREIARGNAGALCMASKETRHILKEWLDSRFHVTIPDAGDIFYGGQTLERHFRVVRDVMNSMVKSRRITSLTVHCDLGRITDMTDWHDSDWALVERDPDIFRMDTCADRMRHETASHYVKMRLVADIVIDNNLDLKFFSPLSVTLKDLQIDGVLARTLGDMLRRSPHLVNLVLHEAHFINDFNYEGDTIYFMKSFFNLKQLTFKKGGIFSDARIYPHDRSFLECLNSATQLTSLAFIECEFDDRGVTDDHLGDTQLWDMFKFGTTYKTLTKLDFTGNKIKSLISIVELLLKIPWLKDLNLTDNDFDDKSLEDVLIVFRDMDAEQAPFDERTLSDHCRDITLKKLNFNKNKFQFWELLQEFLEKLPALQMVDLRSNLFDNKNDCQLHANELFQDRDIEILISE